MRNGSLALVRGAVMIALGLGLTSGARAGDDGRPAGLGDPGPYRPSTGGFEVQVLVGGRALSQETAGRERRVEAVAGAEYELRLTNPLPERVAVAVSVDGLNVIDARHTTPWDAGKWVIHPHGTLTISGWQMSSERARRFTFTTERDSYATRIGRPGDFGVISAVCDREQRAGAEIIIPRRPFMPGREDPASLAAEGPAAAASTRGGARSGEGGSSEWRSHPWRLEERAATGIGSSVPSAVRVVGMPLERQPVAVVTVRYAFRYVPPRPIIVPGFAPEPPERGWNTRREGGRFAPEP